MKKPTALFLAPSLLVITLLGLVSCSTPPKTVVKPQADIVLPTVPQKSPLALRIEKLELAIRQAEMRQNWPEYLNLSEQLWQLADTENQLSIEYMVWQTLSKQFNTTLAINQLANNTNPKLQSWANLLTALNQPGLFKRQALQDLAIFEENALYQANLLDALQWRLKTQQAVRQIAVLLPFKGKYQSISEQIRNGLLKAYMVSDKSVTLRFYDSSEDERVLAQYQLAKKEGADLVIGPLTKEEIDQLAGQNLSDVIALNNTDDPVLKSFNFRTQTEALQITKQLNNNDFQRIGILSSEKARDLSTAEEIKTQWLAEGEKNQAVLSTYSLEKLNLRKALGDLINEEQSQERYNNLRWLLSSKLEFFPRTRKDLQAIVLIGKADQVAVFHPQFEFFQLELPVYATSNLTPTDLKNIQTNKDLGNVIFPTIPAVFSANALNSELEAFGWDSFILANQLTNLAPNLCLTQGQSGILYLDGQQIDKKLVWAQYSANGTLMPWQHEVVELTEQEKLEALIEQERLEALNSELSAESSDASTTDLRLAPSELVNGVQVITPN
ncbi:MAG: penicillin-binding protein activator [Thiotrichales bacterium]|nr:penicillin-binding protein activator [Thiotrichales bacterium]